jgi:serine/threonine-protein kinase RsbW
MRRFSKSYPNEPTALKHIRQDIEAFAGECGVGEPALSELKTAIGEAAMNAVEHGHVPNSSIRVDYVHEDNSISVRMVDSGGGIGKSEKSWEKAIHKPGPGGYGMSIIKAFVDEFRFNKIPGDGAEIQMVKRLNRA